MLGFLKFDFAPTKTKVKYQLLLTVSFIQYVQTLSCKYCLFVPRKSWLMWHILKLMKYFLERIVSLNKLLVNLFLNGILMRKWSFLRFSVQEICFAIFSDFFNWLIQIEVFYGWLCSACWIILNQAQKSLVNWWLDFLRTSETQLMNIMVKFCHFD